jgi:hypothetical protein
MEIIWSKFLKNPKRYFENNRKITVKFGNGSYFIARFYSPIVEDRATWGNLKGTKHKCAICGNTSSTMFTIPFDGKFIPGYYCLYCRRKHDILDVSVAKKHGKIY